MIVVMWLFDACFYSEEQRTASLFLPPHAHFFSFSSVPACQPACLVGLLVGWLVGCGVGEKLLVALMFTLLCFVLFCFATRRHMRPLHSVFLASERLFVP